MEHYVGLDVSLKLTAICIVDRMGKIEREGVVASDPEAIAAFIKSYAPKVVRIGLETGPTATWLWTELRKLGLPVSAKASALPREREENHHDISNTSLTHGSRRHLRVRVLSAQPRGRRTRTERLRADSILCMWI